MQRSSILSQSSVPVEPTISQVNSSSASRRPGASFARMLRNAAVSLCSAAALLLAIGAVSGQVAVAQSAQFAGVMSAPLGTGIGGPFGVAVDSTGNIYVADQAAPAIYKIAPGGATTTLASGSPLVTPAGIAVDPVNGNIFVGDYGAAQVFQITGGVATPVLSGILPYTAPAGVAVDGNHNLYVADLGGAVFELAFVGGTYSSSHVTNLSTLLSLSISSPFGIAVNPAATLLVISDPFAGDVIEVNGGSVTPVFSGSPAGPYAVALDASNNIYVAFDSGSSVTEYFAPSYATTANWGSGLLNPDGLAVDASGNIYTANSGTTSVTEISPAAPNFGLLAANTATSSPVTLAFSLSGGATLGATPTAALSQGVVNGEFAVAGGGTCIAAFVGADCTVNVTFAPHFSGVRNGAVELLNGSGHVLGEGFAYGTGTAPQANFPPGATTTAYTAAHAGTLALGLAVDPAGALFVADNVGNQVMKVVGGVGSVACGGLNAPEGIAIDGAGNLYVADNGSGHVYVKSLSGGTYSTTATFTIPSPSLVAVDGAGNVYVTTTGGAVYQETLVAGVYTQSTLGSSPIANPLGLATDGLGNTYTNAASSPVITKTDYSDPPSLTFATPTPWGSVDSLDSVSFTLANVGNAPLDIEPHALVTDPAFTGPFSYGVSSGCTQVAAGGSPFALAAGSTCIYDVDFTPTLVGASIGTLVLTDNNLNAPSPAFTVHTVNLSGTGSKDAATVTLGSLSQAYTGSPLAATYVTTPVGLTVSLTYTGIAPTVYASSSTPPTAAGSYAVSATISDALYAGSATGTLTITSASATVTLGSLSHTYTGSPLSATATTTPLGLAVTFSYLGTFPTTYGPTSIAPTNAGTYSVTGTISNPSYAGTATAAFTITKATATVALTNLSQAYTGSPLPVTVTTTPSGLAYTISYTGTSVVYPASATPPTGVGTYSVTATVNDPNHTAGTTTNPFSITKATPVISWTNPVNLWWPNPLTTAQLTATASFPGGPVAGTFTYNPLAGTVLLPGPHTLSVSFAPTDLVHFLPGPFTASVPLTVVESGVTIQGISTPIGYPQQLTLHATVIGSTSGKPVHDGTVTFYDGNTALSAPIAVGGDGTAYWQTYPPLAVGTHSIWALYSVLPGSYNAAGYSPNYPVVVNGGQTTINPGCSSSSINYGTNYTCNIHLSASTQTPPQGLVTYTVTYNGVPQAPQTLTLSSSGGTHFTLVKPPAGTYSVAINYAAQSNFSAAAITQNFTVNPAQTIVSLTPSTWNPNTATTLVLSAAVASPSAGAPNAIGQIAFTEGGASLTCSPTASPVPVDAFGKATCSVSGLTLGAHNFVATYTGANYATGSVSINVNVVAAKAASKPIFSPIAGTFSTTQLVTLSDSTPGAVIYYTTDNTTPTPIPAHLYSGALSISQSTVVQAMATAPGYNNSAVASALYNILLAPLPPTFSPLSGTTCSGPQTVTISDATLNTAIYYTTDGSTPTVLHSPMYSAPVTGVSCPGTVKAIAVLTTVPGNTPGATSPVATATYALQVAATPTFSPLSGKFTTPTTITISDLTGGATIYYTTNGTTPTTSSASGVSGMTLTVSSTTTVKAIAVAAHYANSPVASARYTFSTVNLTAASTTLTYPGQTNLTACVTNNNNPAPSGTMKIVDTLSSATLTTVSLQGNGCAYWYIAPALAAGSYSLQAQYSGDANYPAGNSPLVPVTVTGAQVSMAASCSGGSKFTYGQTVTCQASLHSNGGTVTGSVSYQIDGGGVTTPTPNLTNGSVGWTLTVPPIDAGKHVMVVSYAPAAPNFGTASQTIKFTVVAAPSYISVTSPAHSIPVGTSLTATATVTDGTSPLGTGTVNFYDNGALVATTGFPATYTTSTLTKGTHQITATYSGVTDYAAATSSPLTITVTQATPILAWATPASIVYGTPLSTTQLDATVVTPVGLPGKWLYSPAAGAILDAGSQLLTVTFTPNDKTNYAPATASVNLTVTQAGAAPLTWATPADITYPTPLSGAQLNATSTATGTFVYTPVAGTVLHAGPSQTLSVTFTPTPGSPSAADYTAATTTVLLNVNKATPIVTWTTPAPITYGTNLAGLLNATSTVAGSCGSYTATPSGSSTPVPVTATSTLDAGSYTLSCTYGPTDATDYNTATGTTTLTVNKATPVISWTAPTAIAYGTPLSATQLNASSTATGTFVYSPPAGTVLSAGTQTLWVTFTPTPGTLSATDYGTASTSVTLTVNKITPTVTWGPLAPIAYGTTLAGVLNATSTVAGSCGSSYTATPSGGTAGSVNPSTVLVVGSYTLSCTYTPYDTTDYNTPAAATTTLTVTKATPTVTWGPLAPITYGTTLAGLLNASSTVAGSCGSYSADHAVGAVTAATVLHAATYALSCTYTPTDTANYATTTGTTTLIVNKAMPTVTTWPTASSINSGQTLASSTLSGGAASFGGSPVVGTFDWTLPTTVPLAGSTPESVTFTPADTTDFNTPATGYVTVTVN